MNDLNGVKFNSSCLAIHEFTMRVESSPSNLRITLSRSGHRRHVSLKCTSFVPRPVPYAFTSRRSREAAKHVSKSFRERLSRGPVGFSSVITAELPGQIEVPGGSYETIETLSGSLRQNDSGFIHDSRRRRFARQQTLGSIWLGDINFKASTTSPKGFLTLFLETVIVRFNPARIKLHIRVNKF